MKLFTLFIFLVFTSTIVFSQTNVLQNGGFESWTDDIPDSWAQTTDGYVLSQEDTIIFEGSHAAKILLQNTDTQKLRQEDIPIIGGQHYIFRMQVLDNDPAGRVRFWGYWEGDGTSGGPQPSFYTEDSPDWQLYEFEADAHPNATGLSLEIRFYDVSANWDGDALFYIDAIQVLAPSTNAPLISKVTKTIFEADMPITIQATIMDNEGIDTAKIHYKLNASDTEETPVLMSSVNDSIWEGTLPAQSNGTGLTYWISAKDIDDTPNTSTSTESEVMVGITPLAKAHELDDDNMIYQGFLVKVRGIVTAGIGVFSADQQDDYIQDATGGINVFSFNIVKSIAENDSVEIIGEFDSYHNKSEIIPDSIRIINSGNQALEPIVIKCEDMSEQYEGMLIKIESGIISGWQDTTISFSATINDGTGDLTLRAIENTGVPGNPAPAGLTTVTGIGSQYDADYQIMPRSWDDMLITAIENDPVSHLHSFYLNQNYPNPFNPETEIKFSLAEPSDITVSVYNVLGQEILNLISDFKSAGEHSIKWIGIDRSGNPVASGIYIYQLKAGNKVLTRKMALIR